MSEGITKNDLRVSGWDSVDNCRRWPCIPLGSPQVLVILVPLLILALHCPRSFPCFQRCCNINPVHCNMIQYPTVVEVDGLKLQ